MKTGNFSPQFLHLLMTPVFIVGLFLSTVSQATTITNDTFFSEQWYLDTITAPKAWEQTTGSPEVIVAVLDAGFDLDHPELINQYWKNTGEIFGNGKDDDGNGYEDDVQGWDFVDSDPLPVPDFDTKFNDTIVSHGTVIAGIIGASANNAQGITGISHGVRIMPLRILNAQGGGSTSDVRQAIVYAVQNGAQVINLSFTSDKPDERLRQTIEWAVDQGVIMVAAVGNGDQNINTQPSYPACYDLLAGRDLVIGVAATDREDKKAGFSNFGSNCTDVSAPGTNIFATVYHDPSKLLTSTAYSSPWEGTSIAAPMVSATAALMKSVYPLLTPEQITLAIKLSVDPVKEMSVDARKQMGAGRLNIAQALNAAKTFARVGGGKTSKSVKHSHSFVVAQGSGEPPLVKRLDARAEELVSFYAFHEQFRGGVSLAVGDVNGDGQEEIVVGARKGGGPQVRVFDLQGQVRSQFFADDPSNRGGITVGVADTNGDGVDEIFVTPEFGGTGEIKLFNQYGQLQGLIRPFGRQEGQLRLAFGNMDEDPQEEIIVLWSHNPKPAVRILDGSGKYVREFPISSKLANADISSGDLNADGSDEIFLASPVGMAPFVQIVSATGTVLRTFSVFSGSVQTGMRTCIGDIDQNRHLELYVTPRTGGGPHLQIYNDESVLISSVFTFESLNRSGLSCALW